MTDDGPDAYVSVPPGPPGSWEVFTASIRGAAHDAIGLPLQDAVGCTVSRAPLASPLVMAVADGHGDRRHYRSAQGARFAVEVATRLGSELAPGVAGARTPRDVEQVIAAELVPAVVGRWREAVESDLAENPLSEEEAKLGHRDPTIAYGTTLLVAVVAFPWLAAAQIGDGDTVVIMPDGTVDAPVPGDPSLDGRQTTSLCQVDAERAFRSAVWDLQGRPFSMLMLATDGFGNSQTHARWQELVGRDLQRFAVEHGPEWIGAQLPLWAARCASQEGSGDDTSVALLLWRDAAAIPLQPGPTEVLSGDPGTIAGSPGKSRRARWRDSRPLR
ncbi:MAG: protein phosphatase 2C domain-containing protein [Acidimicrobiales bacterium]